MQLNLNQIRTDGGTQPRAILQQDVIQEYQEQMEAGVTFPPPTVFFDGKHYWLADGFHRFAAATRAFPDEPIECDVRQGTQLDAQWFSYSANQDHGLRRTNEEKRRAVVAALSHSNAASLSNCEIARHCGVSDETIRKYREQHEATSKNWKSAAPQTRTGRDGRTINTANIGRSQRRPASESKPRKQFGGISPRAHRPVRDGDIAYPAKTALELPHDAEMGARTLISVFEPAYLQKLVEVLTQYLSHRGANE
jgi:transposase-like protein